MKKILLLGLLGVAVFGLVIQAPQPAQAGPGEVFLGLALLGVVTTAVAVSQMNCDRPYYGPYYRPYYSYHSYCPPSFYWQIGYDYRPYRHHRPHHYRPDHYRPDHYRPHHYRPDHHRPEFRDPRPARGSDGWDTRGGQPGPNVNSGWDNRGGEAVQVRYGPLGQP